MIFIRLFNNKLDQKIGTDTGDTLMSIFQKGYQGPVKEITGEKVGRDDATQR